jgi:hypothetical protein
MNDKDNKTKNAMADMVKFTAYVIFIVGIIGGVASVDSGGDSVAMLLWGGAFVGGMFFLGLSEIIKLLQGIKDNTTPNTTEVNSKPKQLG